MRGTAASSLRRCPVISAPARLAWVALAASLALLAGCGFHLRGSDSLPQDMAVTFISSAQPYSTLADDFAAALRWRGVEVTHTRGEATAVLHILDDETETRVLSVNTAGKVLEYDLRQTVQFSVTTSASGPLVPQQTVTMNRSYLYSSTDVLGKQREDKVVRATLQRNIVDLAMLRIVAAGR